MHQLWEQAANSYFSPEQFRLNLQNCITTSRTVSFIMQSNKSSISGFDDWYQFYVKKWKSDAIMEWAKDSRNVIEKQGDLSIYSQARAKIIASYLGGPVTGWIDSCLFSSNDAIRASIPKLYLNPHVIQHGTMIVERRWVANSLPDMEILEAMSHVYGELQRAIIELTQKAEMALPGWLQNGLPHAMRTLAMDRAAYVSIASGDTYGYRLFQKPIENLAKAQKSALEKRYGPITKIIGPRPGDTLREQAESLFKVAKVMLVRDGYHAGIAFLLSDSTVRIVNVDFPNRAAKYVITRELAKYAASTGATSVIMIGEAWTAPRSSTPSSGFASEAKHRGEALILNAANKKGEHFSIRAQFYRKTFNKKKIKKIEEPDFIIPDAHFMVFPFLQEWSALSDEALKAAIDAEEAFPEDLAQGNSVP